LTPPIDYLVIGHLSHDHIAGGFRLGGTVVYSGCTARALGCCTAMVTSAAEGDAADPVLDGIHVHCLPCGRTTAFVNHYLPQGRRQVLLGRASCLTAAAMPPAWANAGLVHLGPIAAEIDPDIIEAFTAARLVLTPQGWLRGWDDSGRIFPRPWSAGNRLLSRAMAVVLGEEDLVDQAQLGDFTGRCPLEMLTRAAAGCTLFWQGRSHDLAAPAAAQVDPTGAGDIFAAAFFIGLHRGLDPITAAARANLLAAATVAHTGIAAKMAALARAWKRLAP